MQHVARELERSDSFITAWRRNVLGDEAHGAFLQAANSFTGIRIAIYKPILRIRRILRDAGLLECKAVGPTGVPVRRRKVRRSVGNQFIENTLVRLPAGSERGH